jgi:hypothetical protein
MHSYSGVDRENQRMHCGEEWQIGLLVCLDKEEATIHGFRGPKSRCMTMTTPAARIDSQSPLRPSSSFEFDGPNLPQSRALSVTARKTDPNLPTCDIVMLVFAALLAFSVVWGSWMISKAITQRTDDRFIRRNFQELRMTMDALGDRLEAIERRSSESPLAPEGAVDELEHPARTPPSNSRNSPADAGARSRPSVADRSNGQEQETIAEKGIPENSQNEH